MANSYHGGFHGYLHRHKPITVPKPRSVPPFRCSAWQVAPPSRGSYEAPGSHKRPRATAPGDDPDGKAVFFHRDGHVAMM